MLRWYGSPPKRLVKIRNHNTHHWDQRVTAIWSAHHCDHGAAEVWSTHLQEHIASEECSAYQNLSATQDQSNDQDIHGTQA